MKKLIYLFLALTIVACSSDDSSSSSDDNGGGSNNDTTEPVITILGDANVSIFQGTPYTDAGATATDDVDGNLTSSIVTSGTVNVNSIGSYTITYTVSDSAGNTATATRQVIVEEIAIGDSYQGGIIAYIFQSGDTGYVAGETHGLIASTENQTTDIQGVYTTIFQWYNGDFVSVLDATGTAIGTGLTNTNAIIAAQGSGIYAASIARDYNGGGYTDWFLPSKDELNILYENKTAIDTSGGFWNGYFWSSTEYVFGRAWIQNFSNGYQVPTNQDYTHKVRAVRAF